MLNSVLRPFYLCGLFGLDLRHKDLRDKLRELNKSSTNHELRNHWCPIYLRTKWVLVRYQRFDSSRSSKKSYIDELTPDAISR